MPRKLIILQNRASHEKISYDEKIVAEVENAGVKGNTIPLLTEIMKIAIVGATGLVGRNIIQLCEDNFSSDVEYALYASKSSEGKVIEINGTEFEIKELKKENIQENDISLFSAGGERSKEYAKDFINKGSFVIDNSSVYRMNEDVPLLSLIHI